MSGVAERNTPTAAPAAGPTRRPSAAGFTLIELLVVIVIIGSLVSLAMLSVGGNQGRLLQDEAERLAALIGVLSEEATLDNREYGLLLDDQGYRVLRYDERLAVWQTAPGQREHRLPEFARLELKLEGQPLKLAAPVLAKQDNPGLSEGDEAEAAPVTAAPQLLILSSGELSPFSLRIEERAANGAAFSLASDGFALPLAERAAQ